MLAHEFRPGLEFDVDALKTHLRRHLEGFDGETEQALEPGQVGTVLCFVKAGEANTSAALVRLQQQDALLKTRLKQQQNQIDGLKKLVCLDHPNAEVCK